MQLDSCFDDGGGGGGSASAVGAFASEGPATAPPAKTATILRMLTSTEATVNLKW